MNNWKTTAREMRDYLILWATQALSALGSAMTNFALILWSYRETGSALSTAMLSICSYAPYVALSVFAGALSDRWDKRRTMLVCDSVAAAGTAAVIALYFTGTLRVGHLYALNVLSGLMNAVQQPAADVASTLIIPPKHYQKASALRSASGSATSILTPVCAAALMGLAGLELVFAVDLATFFAAFAALMFAVKIPRNTRTAEKKERLLDSARGGIDYLKKERGVLHLILFLAAINLTASAYSAALPAMVLARGRRRGRVRRFERRDRRGDACGQPDRGASAAAEKPCPRDLQYAADLHEHGKFLSRLWAQPACLVRGRSARLACYPDDEREPGRGDARPYPCRAAGARVFGAQYGAVFYHSHRICIGRRAGGRRVRAADGARVRAKSACAAVWNGKGQRRGGAVLPAGGCRRCDLSDFST